ncbi:MAG TPA: universal stress protein [Thermoanaerobaculia bacterium]|nr:universal stress protein [Thermoanaerobaculia bacterium]
MEPPKLILVPTDLSDSAGRALRYASGLAEAFDAHLLVIYADPFIPATDFTIGAAGVFDYSRQALMDGARETLQAHAEQHIAASIPFDLRVLIGTPVETILELAQNSGANLVVMGTHGRTGVRRLLLGSVTEAVMREAAVPVIAVHEDSPDESGVIHSIICPVTLTPACRASLRYAASVLAPNARIILVTSVEHLDAQMGAHELLRIKMWIPAELENRCEIKLLDSRDEVHDVVEMAKLLGCGLIAVGVPTGRSAIDNLRGTPAERVVQQSDCPVVTMNFRVAMRDMVEVAPALVEL